MFTHTRFSSLLALELSLFDGGLVLRVWDELPDGGRGDVGVVPLVGLVRPEEGVRPVEVVEDAEDAVALVEL